jgi:hypothetical protein
MQSCERGTKHTWIFLAGDLYIFELNISLHNFHE